MPHGSMSRHFLGMQRLIIFIMMGHPVLSLLHVWSDVCIMVGMSSEIWVKRVFREDGQRPGRPGRIYCRHRECVGAWNDCVRRCLVVGSVRDFQRWLLAREVDGGFVDQVCYSCISTFQMR